MNNFSIISNELRILFILVSLKVLFKTSQIVAKNNVIYSYIKLIDIFFNGLDGCLIYLVTFYIRRNHIQIN